MKTIKYALTTLSIFLTISTHASVGTALIKVGHRLYTKTQGEAQLLGAAAGSYHIWKKLQTPALKNSSLMLQRSLGLAGVSAAAYAYYQIPKTRSYKAFHRKWVTFTPPANSDLGEFKDLANKAAYPASLLIKCAASYYIATSFFGSPKRFFSEEQIARVGAFVFVESIATLARAGLASASILSSRSIQPKYPIIALSQLAGDIHPDIRRLERRIRDMAHTGQNRDLNLNCMLYGHPGNGKTTLVEALAASTGLPLFSINMADLKDGHNAPEANLLAIFDAIAIHAVAQQGPVKKAILLLDELELIGRDRNTKSEGNNPALTGALMRAMDYFRFAGNPIIVIGCTNYPNLIDPALKRRLNAEDAMGGGTYIELPSQDTRRKIIAHAMRTAEATPGSAHFTSPLFDTNIDTNALALQLNGKSIDQVIRIIKEAYLLAQEAGERVIHQDAIETIIFKYQQASKKLHGYIDEGEAKVSAEAKRTHAAQIS